MKREEWISVIDNRQNYYVSQLADLIISDNLIKEISFNSPTGTGKTVMIAKLIDRLSAFDYFFLITTLSRGSLDKQVTESLKKYTKSKGYVVYGVSSFTSSTHLQGNDIIHSISGNKKLIWLRDEGHIKSNNWSRLIKQKAFKIVNISATNNHVDIQCNFSGTPLLRTPIQLYGNPEDAVTKLLEIKNVHKEVSNYNPCLIVRDVNNTYVNEFLLLAKKYKLKLINITDENVNIQELCKNDNEYDIIINKLKITEGIDIPRASVIFIGNRPNNEATVIQLIGRVRRNALLWSNQIDIFLPENKKLFEETMKTYIFYGADKTAIQSNGGELCMELSDIISLDSFIEKRFYVEDNKIINGCRIAELELLGEKKYSGEILLKDEEGLPIISNISEIYKKKIEKEEEYGWAYKQIVQDKDLVKSSFDKVKYYRIGDNGFWQVTKTVSDNIKYGKLLKLVENRYRYELQSVKGDDDQIVIYKKPVIYDNRRINASITFLIKYLIKYYLHDDLQVNIFLDVSKNAFIITKCANYTSDDVLLYAICLWYKNLLTSFYGDVVARMIPCLTVDEILNLSTDIKNGIFNIANAAKKKLESKIFQGENKSVLSPHLGTAMILHGVADIVTENTIVLLTCDGKINKEDIYKALAYHFLSTKRYDLRVSRVIVYDCLCCNCLTIDICEKNLSKLAFEPAKKIKLDVIYQDVKFSFSHIRLYYSNYGEKLTISKIMESKNIISEHKRYSAKGSNGIFYDQNEFLRNLELINNSNINDITLGFIYRTPVVLNFAIRTNNYTFVKEYIKKNTVNSSNLMTAIECNEVWIIEMLIARIEVDVGHFLLAVKIGNYVVIKLILSQLNITKNNVNDIIRSNNYDAIEKMLKKIKPSSYNLNVAIKTEDYRTIDLIIKKAHVQKVNVDVALKTNNIDVISLVKKNYLRN